MILGWTFHSKGLWASQNGIPFICSIGSPNFGYRSVNRNVDDYYLGDLESQVFIFTKDIQLANEMKKVKIRMKVRT